ncbi:hypothetical protein [Allokutzneria multivorans]
MWFDITRPDYLADDHWRCVEHEANRLRRSLDAGDGSQALSDIKCVVESIARIVLDIEGTPADPNIPFDTVVNRAHQLLAGQPGRELANTSVFGQVATQASKIARNLGQIRNEFGGGHGRARTPDLRDEMVSLALDAGLLWSRWALRRLGYFSEGRPTNLINDLVTQPQNFHAGLLARRLQAANLPAIEARHQRAIGVAVGQRVMRETFVVRWDGLEPCLASDDLNTWPRDYRIGLAYGLWFAPDDRVTLMPQSLREALKVLEPVADCADDLTEWVDRIIRATVPGGFASTSWQENFSAARFVENHLALRPPEERPALAALANHLEPGPPF